MFTLVLAVMIPASAPIAAQEQLPADFLGRWEGISDELPANAQIPVSIELTDGSLGAIAGTHTLTVPSGATCGGNLRLQRIAPDGRWVEFGAEITFGQGICIPDGIITLTRQADGSLSYDWRHATMAVTATGSLFRTDSATSDSVTSDEDGTEWCDQLVTTYAPAPTLSEPLRGTLEQRQGYLTRVNAGVTAADFVASSVVYNPTTSTTTPWDFGYAFRETADQTEVQQIFIDSSGMWHYAAYPDGVQTSGEAPSYNFSPGDPNTLDLVVTGDTASFCLNGQFLSTVQLLPAAASDVYLMTGFLDTTLVNGRLLEYDSFATWPVAAAGAQAVPQAACQWTGDWDTPYGALRLTQNGTGVTGDYDWDQGRISGEAQGSVFRGAWNEAPSRQAPSDAGDLQFTMNANCQSFTGQWRYGTTGEWNFDWSGQRVSG
jgi:hypothetical protein